MQILAFVDHRYFVYRNIGHLAVFVSKVKYTVFYIYNVASKSSVRAASNVDLFAAKLR